MRTIWKQALAVTGQQEVRLPKGAEVLCVQEQGGQPFIWFECDSSELPEARHFNLFGTGHELPDNPGRYVGTFQLQGGSLVFHVYEERGDAE